MNTNVERKGKEKPKERKNERKEERRKGTNQPYPVWKEKWKTGRNKTLSSVPLQMREMGKKCTIQRRVGAAGEGGTVLVNVSPDSGCPSPAPMEEKPVLLSQPPPPSFGLFLRNCSFPSWPFCSKTKKVAGLYSRRQEVGLWGLCLLIFFPKAMQGVSHIFSPLALVC